MMQVRNLSVQWGLGDAETSRDSILMHTKPLHA